MLTGIAPGSVIAGYRVESRIGAGGMAMVLRARDEALGRTVALKVLAPGLADDAAFRERFIRESRAAAVVDHPHIIPVYGAGEADSLLYIAMRFVAGGDLRALIQREGPLSASRAAFLLSPLASALDAGHAAGLVHRDVKPANVLIDTSPGRPDHLYLSDFGLAKGTASTGLTGTGQFLGTLEYCAPEQIGGKPARPQTDQYALACVAYTMFTGTVPFPGSEPTAILWAHMSEPPPTVTALRPDLPPTADPVLARAMAKNPDERYPTCTDFADALRAALGIGSYTTPSSVYSAVSETGQSSAGNDNPVSTALPVPPPPLSTPPAMPERAVPPRETAGPDSPAAPHAPTRSGDSAAFAATAHRPVARPGGPPAPETSPREAVSPARRRRGRRTGVIAAAAVVVVAGGGTTAGLALAHHGNTPPPNPPVTSPSRSLGLIATLTNPSGYGPAVLGFKSDSTVVTVDDQGHAYTWSIPGGSPTPIGYAEALGLASARTTVVSASGGLTLAPYPYQVNVIRVQNTGTGKVVATLTTPTGTGDLLYTFSPGGTEVAIADSNGSTYIWRISG
jgi:serine/threonine protein kinase